MYLRYMMGHVFKKKKVGKVEPLEKVMLLLLPSIQVLYDL
jgi:hypothetical protein